MINTEINDSNPNNSSSEPSSSRTNRISPFYIELEDKWTDLTKNMKDEDIPKIQLKGERLMVLCKTDDDFRETQCWLDTNTKTLYPKEQRPNKSAYHGTPLLH